MVCLNVHVQALAAIVDRLVEIDVEIKLEEHMEEEPVFAMEDDDSQDDSEMLNEMADKLDEMLKLVYQFLTTFAKDADEAMFKETFAALLGVSLFVLLLCYSCTCSLTYCCTCSFTYCCSFTCCCSFTYCCTIAPPAAVADVNVADACRLLAAAGLVLCHWLMRAHIAD